MNLKLSMKKIFVAVFAVLIFQQVWTEENKNVLTVQISAVIAPGSEWKEKFPPQFALWNLKTR